MAELKSCPFCGEKLVKDGYGNWEHIANGCILSWLDSEYGKIFFQDHPDFIKCWNTRTPKETHEKHTRTHENTPKERGGEK